MKGYNVKISYSIQGEDHCFRISLGDAWRDEEIASRLQIKEVKAIRMSNILIKDKEYCYAYLGMRVVVNRMVWIQQYLDVMDKICERKVDPSDYKDVPQDYIGYDNFVNQSVDALANDLDIRIHESDFILGRSERLYKLGYYFTDKYYGWRKMMAAGLRKFGLLETDTVSKQASVFKIVKTLNNHLVALNIKNEPLPYFDEKKLRDETDMVTAEWDLYEALEQVNGIDTAQMLLFVGYKPSRSISEALKSLTKNRNVIVYTDKLDVPIDAERFEDLAYHMYGDKCFGPKQSQEYLC